MLGLCCWMRPFSSCHEWELLFAAMHSLLTAVASLVEGHRLSVRRLQWLQDLGSVTVVRGLSCSMTCGIFPDQGSNPCPLYWQVDSYPLYHQGSLVLFFNCLFYLGEEPINNVVIVSGGQQRTQPYLYTYPFSLKLSSHSGCHITLSRVPCVILS